ncbi:DUF4956 domain-containing protein [Salana multivorans]
MDITALATLLAADLVAIGVLVFGLYLPRHHRRDLMVSFLGINVGVFTVSAALSSSAAGAGLGLGLLGVLSIIRLRSDELGQREVAYYFAALAIGLLGGLAPSPAWLAVAGMALVVVILAIADSPRLMPSSRSRVVVLDRAITDERELHAHLEMLLDADVRTAHVQRLDLVTDTTWVDVRYVARGGRSTSSDETFDDVAPVPSRRLGASEGIAR